MDYIIIDGMRELKLAVLPPIKGRTLVFICNVEMTPVVVWFYGMHAKFVKFVDEMNSGSRYQVPDAG
jgi:hypothetical protein